MDTTNNLTTSPINTNAKTKTPAGHRLAKLLPSLKNIQNLVSPPARNSLEAIKYVSIRGVINIAKTISDLFNNKFVFASKLYIFIIDCLANNNDVLIIIFKIKQGNVG